MNVWHSFFMFFRHNQTRMTPSSALVNEKRRKQCLFCLLCEVWIYKIQDYRPQPELRVHCLATAPFSKSLN